MYDGLIVQLYNNTLHICHHVCTYYIALQEKLAVTIMKKNSMVQKLGIFHQEEIAGIYINLQKQPSCYMLYATIALQKKLEVAIMEKSSIVQELTKFHQREIQGTKSLKAIDHHVI